MDTSGNWYYRMFGQEFGPVPFSELKVLAEFGTIANDDEVRCEGSDLWRRTDAVPGLIPSSSARPAVPSQSPGANVRLTNSTVAADEWYCQMLGQELGPMGIAEMVELAAQGQIGVDDKVRFGKNGKWRDVGTVPRLVAVLPFREPAPPTPTRETSRPVEKVASPAVAQVAAASVATPVPAPAPAVPARATSQAVAPQPATAPQPQSTGVGNDELEKIKAEVAHDAMVQAAQQLVGWAYSPNCVPQWWSYLGGTELGPVGFNQILELAAAGKLQPSDFVRNGILGQYGPAGNLPGLFSAAALLKRANDALQPAKARIAAKPKTPVAIAVVSPSVPAVAVAPIPAAASAVAPVTPPAAIRQMEQMSLPSQANPIASAGPSEQNISSERNITPPSIVQKTSSPSIRIPTPQPSPTPAPPHAGLSSSYSKPVVRQEAAAATRAKKSTNSGTSFDVFRDPRTFGSIGAFVLLTCGWMFLSGSGTDVRRYTELKKILIEVRAKRESQSTDFSDIKARASKLRDEYTPALKREAEFDNPAKQNLLFATRDDLPLMMKNDLSSETPEEQSFAQRLDDIAEILRVR